MPLQPDTDSNVRVSYISWYVNYLLMEAPMRTCHVAERAKLIIQLKSAAEYAFQFCNTQNTNYTEED